VQAVVLDFTIEIALPSDTWVVLTWKVALQEERSVLPPAHTEITTSYASSLTNSKLSFNPYADAFRYEEEFLVSSFSDPPRTTVRGFESPVVIPSTPSQSSSLPKAIIPIEKTWFVCRQNALVINSSSQIWACVPIWIPRAWETPLIYSWHLLSPPWWTWERSSHDHA